LRAAPRTNSTTTWTARSLALAAAHGLKSLTHLLGPVHELLTGDLAVRHTHAKGHEIEHSLLLGISYFGAVPNVFAAGQLIPTLRGILVHHPAEPASPTAALQPTSAALECAGPAATGTSTTWTTQTTARLLADLRQGSGGAEQQCQGSDEQCAT
jgi:hypothetical protein